VNIQVIQILLARALRAANLAYLATVYLEDDLLLDALITEEMLAPTQKEKLASQKMLHTDIADMLFIVEDPSLGPLS